MMTSNIGSSINDPLKVQEGAGSAIDQVKEILQLNVLQARPQ